MPYNSRILKEFGGGCIHYCGNATHHAKNFLATEGLVALNIYNLYNIASVKRLQEALMEKVALFVCDFTPLEYQDYFKELFSTLDHRGMLVCSQYSPVVGLLNGGKYQGLHRDLKSGRKAVYDCIKGLAAN